MPSAGDLKASKEEDTIANTNTSGTERRSNSQARSAGDRNLSPRTILVIFLTGLLLANIYLKGRSRDLPDNYALCSREGKVYTVDESKPQTECIVVHGNKFVDWGKISK